MTKSSVPPSINDPSSVDKYLSERRSFSIRLRIIVAFLLAFLFSFGIAMTSMVFVLRLDAKQAFLAASLNFTNEIQEARRYEKNYFLYGAKGDLYDALTNIHEASAILQNTAREMGSVLSRPSFEALVKHLGEYESLLNRLASSDRPPVAGTPKGEHDLEMQLRRSGHKILLFASDFEKKEREKVRRTAHTFTLVAVFSLVLNLTVMIWLATELTRQILSPLGRAVEYTRRIAAGDFSLITPSRKFKDEFSTLAVAINRMIIELREKQEQLIQSRKMAAIGTLTSGIAHELNNPLNNISISVEALLENLESYSNEQKQSMLEDIFIEIERANGTVRNLLDFTRVQTAKPEPVDVEMLVTSSLRLVNNELAINRIETETDFGAGVPKIRGNLRTLQQVFLNLFLNSIQAMSDGGRLSVRATVAEERFVKVDVTDTGEGISPENLSRIFDPFFTTKEEGKGTGLGLSVSYSIIQKIGGSIAVDTEPGEGTTVHVFLPIFR